MTVTEFRKKWAEALRSGEYFQTRECLHDDDGYCCLGVACKVIDPNYEVPPLFTFGSAPMRTDLLKYLRGGSIDILATFNDSGRTFQEIADRIETDDSLFNLAA